MMHSGLIPQPNIAPAGAGVTAAARQRQRRRRADQPAPAVRIRSCSTPRSPVRSGMHLRRRASRRRGTRTSSRRRCHTIEVTTASRLPCGPLKTIETCASGRRVGVIAVPGELNRAAGVEPERCCRGSSARRPHSRRMTAHLQVRRSLPRPRSSSPPAALPTGLGKARVPRAAGALRPVHGRVLRHLHRSDRPPLRLRRAPRRDRLAAGRQRATARGRRR